MSKKTGPIITHTEILSRAIASIEQEIRQMEEVMGNTPECQQMLQAYVDERTPKIEVLKRMYRYETGVEY